MNDDLQAEMVRLMTPAMGDECTLDELRAYAYRLLPFIERVQSEARRDALTEAADAWDDDSPESVERLHRMADEHYRAGGPSMPAIWLRDRAEGQ